MSVLYVQKQGAKLVKSGGRIKVMYEGNCISSIPNMKVERIVLFGNVKITTPLLKWILFKNINVGFMNSKGQYAGKLSGRTNSDFKFRKTQFLKFEKDKVKIYLIKKTLEAKIKNSIDLLNVFNKRRKNDEITRVEKLLKTNIYKISNSNNINYIRGYEGISAKQYFSVFKYLINDEQLNFIKREKKGSRNPINSVLNYIYGILNYFTLDMLEMLGFDPYNGYYHKVKYNRTSLSLDIMENFRSICDRIVLRLINKKMIDFNNFDFDNKDYILISNKTRNLLIQEFENNIGIKSSLISQNKIISQINSLKKYIKGETIDFEPFIIKRV